MAVRSTAASGGEKKKYQPAAHKGRRSGSGRGLQSRIIKGNKTVKGRRVAHKLFYNQGIRVASRVTRAGGFKILALANKRLSANQLEAARRALKKNPSFKNLVLVVSAYPFAPVTRRPQDVRMGKGKGNRINRWICPVRTGQVLFDISLPQQSHSVFVRSTPFFYRRLQRYMRELLTCVESKLSIPVRIIHTFQLNYALHRFQRLRSG